MWQQWRQLHGRHRCQKNRDRRDLTVLRVAGMEAKADPEIWKAVWTKEERINNASTPMFLVEGVKKDA